MAIFIFSGINNLLRSTSGPAIGSTLSIGTRAKLGYALDKAVDSRGELFCLTRGNPGQLQTLRI
jgi:hypothetical protein